LGDYLIMAITINGTTGISGVDGSAGTPALQGSDPNTGIYSPAANQVAVATNGVGRLFVASDGKVGIGNANPSEELEITSATPALKMSDTDEAGSYGTVSMASSVMYVQANGAATGGQLIYRSGNAGTFTERLRITSAGLVGIGTSSPAYKCDIDVTGSALRLNSTTTGAALVISSDDAANAKIEFGDESDNDRGAITYDNPNNALIFQANAAERLRIANTGAFGLSGANYGTSGQVLTSQGSGSAPQWVSAGYTSLGRTNTTSGASHTVTGIPTTARHVVIVFSNISVNTANTPQLTFQVGNGSLSTGDYYWSIAYGTNFQALNATSSVRVFHTDFNSPSNSYFGVIEIYPTDPYIIGYIQATVQGNQPSRGSFKWAGSSAIDRVNLSTASTFDAGHFVVYYI
jgi:hypothetical protein